MRSIIVHVSVIAIPFALAGGLTVAACGSVDSMSSFQGAQAAKDSPGNNGTPTFAMPDASSTPGSEKRLGSPLCSNAQGLAFCTPDEAKPCGASGTPPPDAGLSAADAGPETSGCRVEEGYIPMCGIADRRGVDGVACTKGSDCAPGFDCVDGDRGPVCRRYCCSGSCDSQASQNGGPTFCDIRRVISASNDRRAPVCMPLKTCKLLRVGECTDKETCAIVTEKGDTGCVPKGNAKVGQSCDKENCDAGLTCLGSPGDRRCYKLCRVDGADCGAMQTCTTGAVFQDTNYGVCKDD